MDKEQLLKQMIPVVLQDGNPILRKIAVPVTTFDQQLTIESILLIAAMIANNGIGIAAPQIGISKRMLVFCQRVNDTKQPFIMINPNIIDRSEQTQSFKEGCLSVANTRGHISRAQNVTVEYQNIMGMHITETFSDFTSTVIQHEIDHLNGILFTDYL